MLLTSYLIFLFADQNQLFPVVCRNLTDMSVFELAGLPNLRRLSLVRVHKLTDIGVFALAEQATGLERLHLSYCDHLSLDAIHLLLRKLDRLQHLTATGIPSLRRRGVHRFSEPTPAVSYNLPSLSHKFSRLLSDSNLELRSGSAGSILCLQWDECHSPSTLFG